MIRGDRPRPPLLNEVFTQKAAPDADVLDQAVKAPGSSRHVSSHADQEAVPGLEIEQVWIRSIINQDAIEINVRSGAGIFLQRHMMPFSGQAGCGRCELPK